MEGIIAASEEIPLPSLDRNAMGTRRPSTSDSMYSNVCAKVMGLAAYGDQQYVSAVEYDRLLPHH